MSKHTKGPWKISEQDYGDELWFGGEGCGLITVNGWANGGCKDKPKEWAKMKADARLIAAAPDLLKACELFIRWSTVQPVIQINHPAFFEMAMIEAIGALKKVKAIK